MELLTIVLFVCCFQVDCTFLLVAFCLLGWYNEGSSGLTTRGSPLSRILEDWNVHCCYPMSKEVLICYCNTVWPMHDLDFEERWTVDGSLSYCIIKQLERYCQWLGKWEEIHYVSAFMPLYIRVSSGTKKRLMV